MFCRRCYYNLRGTEGEKCPECGLWFDPQIPLSFSQYSIAPWRVAILKLLSIFSTWWVSLAAAIVFGLLAVFLEKPFHRIVFGICAILNLYNFFTISLRGSSLKKALQDARAGKLE